MPEKDEYLTPAQVTAAANRVTLDEGTWKVRIGQHPTEGMTVSFVGTVRDADDASRYIDLGVDDFLPPIPDERYLWRWLFWRWQRILTHELRETFLVDGVRIYDPHRNV